MSKVDYSADADMNTLAFMDLFVGDIFITHGVFSYIDGIFWNF
jgi:hypothetical protein